MLENAEIILAGEIKSHGKVKNFRVFQRKTNSRSASYALETEKKNEIFLFSLNSARVFLTEIFPHSPNRLSHAEDIDPMC